MAPKAMPSLPPEIWSRIVRWSVNTDSGDFHGWNKTRLVNKLFKDTVEQYFMDHYLKYTRLMFDAGGFRPTENSKVNLSGPIKFEKLDEEGRRAVFLYDGIDREYRSDMKVCMDDSVGVHTNCKAGFIIIVRRIISDVPALNLKCDYSSLESEGAVRLSFDWRSTMTIIMSEEEVIDNGVTASVSKHDPEVLQGKVISGELSMEQALKAILKITTGGQESAWRSARRARRRRLLKRVYPTMEEETIEESCKDDESEVLKRFKNMRLRVDLANFSDEESYEGESSDGEDRQEESDGEGGSNEDWESEEDGEDDDGDDDSS